MEDNEVSNKILAEDLTVTQRKEIERKRVEEGTKKENMIASEEGIIDVVDLINDSGNNYVAVRIKTLLENGVTEDMIKSKYMDISAGVSDKNIALQNLRNVCDMFVKYVSEQANGIVINPITGEVDQKRSLASAIEYGIIKPDNIVIFNPIDGVYEIHRHDSFIEILDASKLFSIEDKELNYWNYNRNFGEMVKTSRNSVKNWESFDEYYTAIATQSGKTEEEIKKELEKFRYYDLQTVEEMDFAMKAIFFANKDTKVNKEILLKTFEKYKDTKFYKDILNDKGEFDLDKIKVFADNLIKVTNLQTLLTSLEAYNNVKGQIELEGLDEVNKANLFSILAKGVLSENEVCKEAFENLCKKIGIGSTEEEIIEVIGCRNKNGLKEIAEESDMTNKNYRKIISDLKIFKQMTPAEKMIYEITENRNLHIADERESIARLYMMYCEKAKDYDLYTMEQNTNKEIAKAIEHYMLDKKEYFTEYFTYFKDNGIIVNKLNYDYVKKVIGDKEPSKKTTLLMESTPKKIARRLETLKGEDSKISQEEFDEFFMSRSEELAISYERESQERREAKASQKSKFTQADISDLQKLNLYKAESVDDASFAQIALYYSNKTYKSKLQDIKGTLFKYRNSKFYQSVLDENDEVDLNKLKEFSRTYTEEFNRDDLRRDTVKYLLLTRKTNVKWEDLDEVNKKNLQGILARGYLTEDLRNKKAFIRLCQNLGIGSDEKSILEITGCSDLEDLEEIRDDQNLNSLNYREKLSERRFSKKMSLGEKRVFEIANDLDLYDPENAEIIARTYVMYYEKMKELPENSGEAKSYGEIAMAFERLMKEHNEKFSGYMTTIRNGSTDIKNKVDYANVKKILETKQLADKENPVLHSINEKIENMVNSLKGEDGQISKEDFLHFFDERTEKNAKEFRKEALKKVRDRNRQIAEERKKDAIIQEEIKPEEMNKKENNGENQKESPFVSWVKKTVTTVRDSFKKMISRRGIEQLDKKDIKLLEEPKDEKILTDEKNIKTGFVQIVDINHEKALEETKKAEGKTSDVAKDIVK